MDYRLDDYLDKQDRLYHDGDRRFGPPAPPPPEDWEPEEQAEDEPKPYAKEVRLCRVCERLSVHQFWPNRNRWMCLACGAAWASPKELVERASRKWTAADIWAR